MDADGFYLAGMAIGGTLAIINALVGALFMRSGNQERGRKYFIFGAAMLMLTIALMLSRGG